MKPCGLADWYIELALLYILNFNQKYSTDVSGSQWEGEGKKMCHGTKARLIILIVNVNDLST
jgi:hypothetical protein